MKHNNWWILGLVCLFTGFSIFGCQKENLGNAGDLFLSNDQDTIRFDTVFTATAQITQKTKIFNRNSPSIKLSSLKLAGGQSSPFKMNVNGQAGSSFTDLTIEGGDSLYVFITVNLPEGKQKKPLFYKDSIVYHYNQQEGKILLYAYGQDAYRLTTKTIAKDTTWNSDLPIIMDGNVTVAGSTTLLIEKGTRVYAKAGTSLIINGTLKAMGDYQPEDQIVMTGNRLDAPYNQLPGGWGGIRFGPNSKGNQLKYVTIKNAVTGITDTARTAQAGPGSFNPALKLYGCQISNSSKNAVHFQNASVSMTNCLLYNATQLVHLAGGDYQFTYCTLAAYTNDYIAHSEPILTLKNINNLKLTTINSIIYGDNETIDELSIEQAGAGSASLNFSHCLIKNAQKPATGTYNQCIWAEDPEFAIIDNQHTVYDFQVLNGSAAIHTAKTVTSVPFDLKHRKRSVTEPTIGCLEFTN